MAPTALNQSDDKQRVIASVDAHARALAELSDEIWRHAEITFRETESAPGAQGRARGHSVAGATATGF